VKNLQRSIAILLTLFMVVGSIMPLGAAENSVSEAIKNTAAYLYKTVQEPEIGSVGGEWTILGLGRSGYPVPEKYFQDYYAGLEKFVKEQEGVLHDKKYTEYSRVIVALTAIGKDPRNVAGYNLLTPLGDYEKVIWQGINGPIWALIALDSGNYPMPQNPAASVQATREMYIEEILSRQLPDGGFSLLGGTAAGLASGQQVSDPDLTGMALQALAKYQEREDVQQVIEEALNALSKMQNKDGGFMSWGEANLESCVQVIVALTELGISLDDSRFVKNGNTILDNLFNFYLPGQGFSHVKGGGSDLMATEQGLYGLVAVQRATNKENSLYRMSDALEVDAREQELTEETGLQGKHVDVRVRPVVLPGQTFVDVQGHLNQDAIEELASRQIIAGKGGNLFDPSASLTRAELAAIVVKALGLDSKAGDAFRDVPRDSWYAGAVGAAFDYGLVSGTSVTTFDPQGLVTREQAAAFVAKAARLAGLDTSMEQAAVRDTLAPFADYISVAPWAQGAVAFCYSSDILPQSDMEIKPQEPIQRGQMAEMLFKMLQIAKLL
jgi:uncharacterized protein YqgV (UPF0045/DUF77 family)